ncbi:MAG: FecR domain-containing protein [Kangiellaceae bacterium]|jgi:transmembrane sensor
MGDTHSNNSDLAQEACAWIAQIESESMTACDHIAFEEWLDRSPAHRAEILRFSQFSSQLNVLTEMAVPLKEAINKKRQVSAKVDPPIWKSLKFATSCAVFLAVILFSSQWVVNKEESLDGPVLYKTAVGSYRKIMLSDGTLLELNTNSEVEVDYTETRRKVRLLNGEAFFQVAHSKKRPFIVYAGERSVRAIGTAFVVSLLPKSFEVTVTEGKVELSKAVPAKRQNLTSEQPADQLLQQELSSDSIYMSAGESVIYNPQVEVEVELNTKVVDSVSKREILRKLSWQDGLLDFSETPLIEVIEDLSRYTTMKIEIEDPELQELKFGGLFRTNELQALFDALEMTFDIEIEKLSEQHVKLSRKKTSNI